VRAAVLARTLGRARDDFKRDVRKLKRLGLTISLEIGYRLSEKGEALLAAQAP
jgi:biotin operon repressor